jgi:uncharacterized C2H2 Zn-finger protein
MSDEFIESTRPQRIEPDPPHKDKHLEFSCEVEVGYRAVPSIEQVQKMLPELVMAWAKKVRLAVPPESFIKPGHKRYSVRLSAEIVPRWDGECPFRDERADKLMKLAVEASKTYREHMEKLAEKQRAHTEEET